MVNGIDSIRSLKEMHKITCIVEYSIAKNIRQHKNTTSYVNFHGRPLDVVPIKTQVVKYYCKPCTKIVPDFYAHLLLKNTLSRLAVSSSGYIARYSSIHVFALAKSYSLS